MVDEWVWVKWYDRGSDIYISVYRVQLIPGDRPSGDNFRTGSFNSI